MHVLELRISSDKNLILSFNATDSIDNKYKFNVSNIYNIVTCNVVDCEDEESLSWLNEHFNLLSVLLDARKLEVSCSRLVSNEPIDLIFKYMLNTNVYNYMCTITVDGIINQQLYKNGHLYKSVDHLTWNCILKDTVERIVTVYDVNDYHNIIKFIETNKMNDYLLNKLSKLLIDNKITDSLLYYDHDTLFIRDVNAEEFVNIDYLPNGVQMIIALLFVSIYNSGVTLLIIENLSNNISPLVLRNIFNIPKELSTANSCGQVVVSGIHTSFSHFKKLPIYPLN